MDNKEKLEHIARQIRACKECKIGTTGLPVPGEGNAEAKIVFIGEAPGKEEAKTGRPFVGRSGKLLRSLIKEIGLQEQEVFITSPVKYLPKQGTPSPVMIAHGRLHLETQLRVIQPKLLVLLGRVASEAVLGRSLPVSIHHGRMLSKNGMHLFLTYHPAAAIRFRKFDALIRSDFSRLRTLIQKMSRL